MTILPKKLARLAVFSAFCIALVAFAADPPAAPKTSTFAPADVLVKQARQFATDFETALASEQTYNEAKDNIKRDANTLAAVALALAVHDAEHPLKQSAPAVAKAAQQLAKANDLAAAKAGVDAVKAALDGKAADGVERTWNQRIGSLGQMMKQVTNVNNRLRRNVRRFDRLADDNLRDAALLAVLAQASTFDTHEVKDQTQIGKWYELCGQMRDTAAQAVAGIQAKDQKATENALAALAKSCDQCHEQFRIEIKP